MYTEKDRKDFIQQILNKVKESPNILGTFLIGSCSIGFNDIYSVIDLMMAYNEDTSAEIVKNEILNFFEKEKVGYIMERKWTEKTWGISIYMKNGLSTDISFGPLNELKVKSPQITIAVDKNGKLEKHLQTELNNFASKYSNYKIDEKWLARRRTTDILPSETPITQTIFVDNYGLHNFCRYREYYKYYYYIKHIFYDDNYYASSPKEGYPPDVSDIKTYYRYKLSSKKTPEELDQENKKDDDKTGEKNNDKKENKEDTSQENNNNNNIPPTPNKDNDHYQSNPPTIAPSTEITSSLIPINNVPSSPILTEQINTKNTSSNNKPTILFPLFLVTLIVLNIILSKTQKNVERIN